VRGWGLLVVQSPRMGGDIRQKGENKGEAQEDVGKMAKAE
jgi:hypothetical protein